MAPRSRLHGVTLTRAERFEAAPEAAKLARRFVRDTLADWDKSGEFRMEAVVDDVLLLTSELVTNAVVHAGTTAEVTCELRPGPDGAPAAVRVQVADQHPGK